MMTSLLLVDVQGFEALAKGQANPAALIETLSNGAERESRHLAVMRAYCSNRVSSYRRTAYREAGFEIVETSGPDETLIRMSFDLYEFSASDATYEEAILLGGSTDYTALARLARERLMMVSVVDHSAKSSALEALADGLIDLDDFEIDRSASIAPAPSYTARERKPLEPLTPRAPFVSRTEKGQDKSKEMADDKIDEKSVDAKSDTKSEDDKPHLDHPEQHKPDSDRTDGDAWPDPKTGPVLVAGATAGAGAAALIASDETDADADDAETEAKSEAEDKAEASADTANDSKAESTDATALDADLENSIAASLSDDLAVSLSEDLGTDLDAELEAELAAELVADAPEGTDASTPKPNGAAVPVEEDSSIDALFADLTDGDEAKDDDKNAQTEGTETTAVDPAVTAAPIDVPLMADVEADADVDQLLSRLMSDDLAGDDAEPKKAELDVVPER